MRIKFNFSIRGIIFAITGLWCVMNHQNTDYPSANLYGGTIIAVLGFILLVRKTTHTKD